MQKIGNIFGSTQKEEEPKSVSGRFLTAIDFGSGTIKVAVGENTHSGVKVVFYGETPSVGIRNGEISNQSRVSETLKTLIAEAEKKIGESIDDAVISLSGRQFKSQTLHLKFQRADSARQIVSGELSNITRTLFKKEFDKDDKVYDVIPQRYDIGDLIGVRAEEIPGMTGERIEGDFLFASGKKSLLQNRNQVMDLCGIKVVKAIPSPIASARAVLTEQEMENGAVLVDIGKGNTEIVIVHNFLVRAIQVIPFAGDSITNDIRSVTNLSSKWAENVKCNHGCALQEYAPENKKLILKNEEGNIDGEIELALLSAIIEARLSEIMDAVRYVIDNSGYGDKLPGGVILTGGTSYMSNIQELAKALIGRKVRLGAPRNVSSESIEECHDLYCSTVVGLLGEGFSKKLSSVYRNSNATARSASTVNNASSIRNGQGGGFFGDWRNLFNNGTEQSKNEEISEENKKRIDEEEERKKTEERKRKEAEKARKDAEKARKEAQKKSERERMERESNGGFFGTFFGTDDSNKA